MQSLNGKKVAILATDGFEQMELLQPKAALEEAGAMVTVVSPMKGEIRGWHHTEWGQTVTVDMPVESADASNFDALVLPGGVMNPDKLRVNPKAVQFVKAFFENGKPIAAICHGPCMLVEAGIVNGRRLTSWPSLQTDIRNAGGDWVDQEVVEDDGFITSRKPADIPAFNQKLIGVIAGGKKAHKTMAAA